MNDEKRTHPNRGGSFIRDPETGELSPNRKSRKPAKPEKPRRSKSKSSGTPDEKIPSDSGGTPNGN